MIEFADNFRIGTRRYANQFMRDTAINRIMTTNPETVQSGDPAMAAKELLESGDIHHLPVIHEGKLVGIVSSTDLLKLYLLDEGRVPIFKATVRQIMQSDPVVLESGANLRDAAEKLSEGGFHALPVVDPDRTLVGIVTSSDLIDHLLQQIPTGDGSIRTRSIPESAFHMNGGDIASILREAEQAAERGDGDSNLTQALLYLRERNRMLKEACRAADLYVRSGHGVHEHSVLVKRLADLR
jgi:CBS domain-containing membrane protein